MADSLGIWTVDHSNSTLQARLLQDLRDLATARQREEEGRTESLVEHCLVTAGQRLAHAFSLRRAVPVARRGHSAVIGRESRQRRFSSIPLAHELTHVQLPSSTHFCCPSVA